MRQMSEESLLCYGNSLNCMLKSKTYLSSTEYGIPNGDAKTTNWIKIVWLILNVSFLDFIETERIKLRFQLQPFYSTTVHSCMARVPYFPVRFLR